MKKKKRFIPLKRNIFIKNFINDFIEALISFFIGAAIEAIFNLEIVKAFIFFFVYIFCIIIFKNNKNISNNKNYRGMKEKSNLIDKDLGRIIFIIGIILFSKMDLSILFAIFNLIWKTINRQVYYILNTNLISNYTSKTLDS